MPHNGGNVMVRWEDDSPVLIDSGFAYTPEEEEGYMRDAIVGTPSYMAPEQFSGAEVRPSADLYALGVIAYEWLTSRHPIDTEGLSSGERFEALATRRPQPLRKVRSDLPAGLTALVDNLLRREPDSRPRAREVQGRLELALAEFELPEDNMSDAETHVLREVSDNPGARARRSSGGQARSPRARERDPRGPRPTPVVVVGEPVPHRGGAASGTEDG